MIKRWIAAALACVGLFSVVASPPETEIGSRVIARKETSVRYSEAEALAETRNLADCLVRLRRADARLFLDATDTANRDAARHRLFRSVSSCNISTRSLASADAQRFQMPLDLERGLIAEMLLRGISARPALPNLPLTVSSDAYLAVTGRPAVVDEMAVCVAAVDPTAIVKLVSTPSMSPTEHEAFIQLMPDLGKCLASNAHLTANQPSLRAALAEALYHRVTSSGTATSPSAR